VIPQPAAGLVTAPGRTPRPSRTTRSARRCEQCRSTSRSCRTCPCRGPGLSPRRRTGLVGWSSAGDAASASSSGAAARHRRAGRRTSVNALFCSSLSTGRFYLAVSCILSALANDALRAEARSRLLRRQPRLPPRSLRLWAEGRLLGLLGRNGAGKSTSMTSPSVCPAPTATSPCTAARSRTARGDRGQGVALVPQGGAFFRSLTVRENLGGGRAQDRAWAAAPVDASVPFPPLFPRLQERHSMIAAFRSGASSRCSRSPRADVEPTVLLRRAVRGPGAPDRRGSLATIRRLKAQGFDRAGRAERQLVFTSPTTSSSSTAAASGRRAGRRAAVARDRLRSTWHLLSAAGSG